MQDAARERDRLRAEREGIQHQLSALDDSNLTRGQHPPAERAALNARLQEIDGELDRLNDWFDQLPPDQRPT
jgi:hypothetical protein